MRRGHKSAWAALVFAWGIALSAEAQPQATLFEQGYQALIEGDTEAALARCQRLIEAGLQDASVEFNCATAYAAREDYPRALLHYERAWRLEPSAEDAEAGAAEARRMIVEARVQEEGSVELSEGLGLVEGIYHRFSEPVLAISFLVIECLLLLLLVCWRRTQSAARAAILALSGVLAFALLFCGLGVLQKRGVFSEGAAAIVVEDHASLREGPDLRARSRGALRAGDWVTTLGREEGFAHVRGEGGEGWVELSAIGPLEGRL